VRFVQLAADYSGVCAAPAVFVFEHGGIFSRTFLFQILLVNAEFSVLYAAASNEYRVNILL